MPHADTDPVMFHYSSSSNITFRGETDSGYTWGEWRDLDQKAKNDAMDEALYALVDFSVKDDE